MFKPFTHVMSKSTKKSALPQNVERDAAICADRRAGMTFTAIEKKYGITRERARQVCDAAGLPKAGRGRRPTPGERNDA
ncbi:MAG TPA: hypothetical protein VGD45_20255 [Steroidobacter sp.]|uniref:hypothetical protein n=1 Tax=Steroidobacter sp. TaxID=1978227 RepID=UPI002EDA5658